MASTDYALEKSSGDSVASDSSSLLRERRAKQLRQERSIRSRMNRISSPVSVTSRNRISSPDSSSAISTTSSGSVADDTSLESSLLSLSLSRGSGKGKDKENLRWEKMEVEFAFGLLTSVGDAPKKGQYGKKTMSASSSSRQILETSSSSSSLTATTASSSKLLDRSPILRHIIQKAKELSKAAVKHRSGNVIIKAKSPYVISVVRDCKCISMNLYFVFVICLYFL